MPVFYLLCLSLWILWRQRLRLDCIQTTVTEWHLFFFFFLSQWKGFKVPNHCYCKRLIQGPIQYFQMDVPHLLIDFLIPPIYCMWPSAHRSVLNWRALLPFCLFTFSHALGSSFSEGPGNGLILFTWENRRDSASIPGNDYSRPALHHGPSSLY